MKTKKLLLLILVAVLFIPKMNVSAIQEKDIYSKTILKSQENIEKDFEQQLNYYINDLKNQNLSLNFPNNEIRPLDRSKYVTELVGSTRQWFGPYKAGGQNYGPVSFPSYGGSIYWEAGSGPNVSAGVTINGQYVSFTLNIGSRTTDRVTGYSVNVPNYGSWYLYVERQMEVRKYNIYKIANGRKTYYTSTTSTTPIGVRLSIRQN